ncbi:MAG: hypothetical protein Q8859_09310, partial [Bacteroidota bacterium]|nr:hypothetical protein [Bacteroidota bacterium]
STDNGRVMVGKPKLDVEVSDNDKYSLEIHYTSKGNDEDDARKNLKAITYNINPKDSVIVFDPFFVFKKNTQWRKQDVKMTLKVPVGKTIYLGDNMMDIIFDINNVTHVWDGDMVGKYWTMTDDGLTLRDSIKVEKNVQKVLNVKKRIKK